MATTSTVSSKMQITIPAAVRKALGIKPGDRLELRVVGDHVELRKVRPSPAAVVRDVLEQFDFQPLHEETGGDAVRYVRKLRWGDDQP
ncbi:MAG: AbrB/MazE/SpoVT family DNA-binding domain-containing protein [Armatimonadota bacterium]|nr:AbrB/MazE/SpoVT family DNA-binding domain-containing protein [Armatimonadota bacterium]MDR7388448.1 AbrB/MazE/SpoVT family DNA-binding domain-containing protein [Armatimonadota bacterium]MDR7392734.1 AbrB/MazE/SpoVT family DNA-binding domain-containing protein [Armatimonadota bacterium]MDR7399580.1 AbrB/MazE/SpoVT family DNA-binding domain-containing protein [Armatimonadota bacterium]MDR7405442.1 AbrB/MazE/SpoVT family DNA-binding domain-containing protein [Armatimonadota bacterium]